MKTIFCKKNIPVFVLIFFGIILSTMGILNHYYFRTYTYDYGNYNFAFWDYHLSIEAGVMLNIKLYLLRFLSYIAILLFSFVNVHTYLFFNNYLWGVLASVPASKLFIKLLG